MEKVWITCERCNEVKPASADNENLCAKCYEEVMNPPTLGIHVEEVIRTDDHTS